MTSGGTLVEYPPLNGVTGRWSGWFNWLPSWRPTSEELLEQAEKSVMQGLTSEYKDTFVPIGPNAVIRTLIFEPEEDVGTEELLPLVMIHGFGAGIFQFYKNLDHLHSKRRVFAFDLPGFARSTRINFSPDAEAAEEEFVAAIEKWRENVGLEKFIILGHSLGAFLSCSYAMKYPSRVRHLILNDPWGFPIHSTDPNSTRRFPFWVVAVGVLLSYFKPLTAVRVAGPLGPYLVNRVRPDLGRKFGDDFMTYVYHCNAQNPTGETAFSYMQLSFGWARRPMVGRIDPDLDPSVPITFIYGLRSWMDKSIGETVREMRPNSYVGIHYVRGASHHVHADKPEAFNTIVNGVCSLVDTKGDLTTPTRGDLTTPTGEDPTTATGESDHDDWEDLTTAAGESDHDHWEDLTTTSSEPPDD